jgi:hypothetical protein
MFMVLAFEIFYFVKHKKGSPVHVAPACAGSGEGSDHFMSYVSNLSLHFCKSLFHGLEPMTSLSQGTRFFCEASFEILKPL